MHNLAVSPRPFPVMPAFETPDSAFCITVYNEPLEALKKTLGSIVEGIAHDEAMTGAGRTSCLCIIVDGAAAADRRMLDWFARCGLTTDCLDIDFEGEAFNLSLHDAADLRAFLDLEAGRDSQPSPSFRVVTCVKPANLGKLHSHVLFFRHLCNWLRPTFCVQIDTGTVIERSAYSHLLERMRDEPDVGALAPCIMTSEPHDASPFISTWQYFDFVLQKSLSWPFEVASGYLSVVPGQFCMFRASALQGAEVETTEEDGGAPVDGYLRGLGTTDPLERVMFLAEDRVVGNEIVLARRKDWQLQYAPEASAATDACTSLGELIRQRRRWNNSALACRLWLFGKLPGYLARSDRSLAAKGRFCVAMLSQLILMVLEFGAPAVTLGALAAFAGILVGPSSPAGDVAKGVLGGSLLAMIFTSWLRSRGRGTFSTPLLVLRTLFSLAMSVAMCVILVAALPSASLTLIVCPSLFIAGAIALLNWRYLVQLALWQNFYVVANLVLSPLLASYAILNIHDVSWGTRGLTTSVTEAGFERRMGRLRAAVIGAWAITNLGLMVLAFAAPGLTSPRLNLVFELTCAIGALTSVIAVAHLARLRISKLFGWRPSLGFKVASATPCEEVGV